MRRAHGGPAALAEDHQQESRVDPARMAAVRGVVDSLLIALKTYILFPPYSVNVARTLDSLEGVLGAFFAEHLEALVLDTSSKGLQLDGEPIFADQAKTRDLSYRMHKDGVVRLILHEGVDRQELISLLEVHQQAAVVHDYEDDFVTLLWEKDCTHIQLVTHDTLLDPSLVPDLAPLEQLETKVFAHPGVDADQEPSTRARHAQPGSPIRRQLLQDPSPILTLEEAERRQLEELVRAEAGNQPLDELVDLVSMVCQADREWATFEAGVKAVGSTIDAQLVQSNFRGARTLAAKLGDLKARSDLMSPRHIQRIDQALEALGQGEPMAWITEYLNEPKHSLDADLSGLLLLLRGNAVRPLFEVLTAGRHMPQLAAVLAHIGRDTPLSAFHRGLESDNPEVVHHTVDLMFQIGGPDAARHLLPLLAHPDASLRQHGLSMLAEHGGAAARSHILGALGDRDRRVRKTAIAELTKRPFPDAFEPIWQAWEGRAKVAMDSQEEEALLGAAAQCNPELAVQKMTPMVTRRALFARKRREIEEQQRLVVFALARAANPVADAALRRFATSPSTRLRQLCHWALQQRPRHGDGAEDSAEDRLEPATALASRDRK